MNNSILKMRDGYKTLSVYECEDGSLRLIVHRPPGAWLEFNIAPENARELAAWLEGCNIWTT